MRRKLGNRVRSRHQDHAVISANLCAACEGRASRFGWAGTEHPMAPEDLSVVTSE